ncbi:MAG: FeoA family protein [Bdellovibrionota bacterium]
MNLSSVRHLASGSQFEITAFVGEDLVRERLHELGLRHGLVLEYRGAAPWGGPLIFHFKAVSIALRPEEASCLEVKPL